MDTIFALSSGAPPAGIAVVRISGPAAFDALRALAGGVPEPRRAKLAALQHPRSGELLDRALVLAFPGPGSATGEDLAELHLHGGRAVIRSVEAALAALSGLRQAEPGEFTRRALLNGRIDLSEAEGLGDLLAAETEGQRRMALRAAEGGVRHQVEAWVDRILVLSARVEALLDHSDEDDVGAEPTEAIAAEALVVADEVDAMLRRPPVERLRDGLRVVLAGPPNAGKSTLLNALVGRDAAIVSPIAGTTRDRIEAPVVRDGIAYVLTDTAGLSERPGDPIEEIGIARAKEALAEADIILWLGDEEPPAAGPIWIHARADVREQGPAGALPVSALTGAGIDALWAALTERARDLLPPPDLIAMNRRQRDLCESAAGALLGAHDQPDLLIVAEHLRGALRAFDAVTGRADVEAMLDALFARFCIGK
jgi:tRNA modification GTPase